MRFHSAVAGAVLIVVGLLPLRAQESVRGPDGSMRVFVPGVDVLPIAGSPFSAASTMDWIRTMPDGSTVKRHLNATMARDSAGRVYRERRHFVVDETKQAPLYETIVRDPVNGTETTCTLATRHCVMRNFRPRSTFRLAPAGPFPNGSGYLTRDSLGTDTMQGLTVTGTRETVTLNAGVAGNSSALVTTREFWYSPDLQTNLAVTRNDPATGQQIIRLNSISRSEPEASQFAVPEGFTVEDARTPKRQP